MIRYYDCTLPKLWRISLGPNTDRFIPQIMDYIRLINVQHKNEQNITQTGRHKTMLFRYSKRVRVLISFFSCSFPKRGGKKYLFNFWSNRLGVVIIFVLGVYCGCGLDDPPRPSN